MTKEERISELLWSCDSYEQMCERVVALEELVADMYERIDGIISHNWAYSTDDLELLHDRMKELGVPMEVNA